MCHIEEYAIASLLTLNEHNLEVRVGIGKTSRDDAACGASSAERQAISEHVVRRHGKKVQERTLQRSRRLPLGDPYCSGLGGGAGEQRKNRDGSLD